MPLCMPLLLDCPKVSMSHYSSCTSVLLVAMGSHDKKHFLQVEGMQDLQVLNMTNYSCCRHAHWDLSIRVRCIPSVF